MKNKGFALIELLVVVMIIFAVLVFFAVPFIIPWMLEKNNVGSGSGSGSGSDIPVFTTVTDGGVIVSKGEMFTLEIEPPFISSEEIHVTVLNPPYNASISRHPLGVTFLFYWTPKETGFFDIEFEFSDGERRGKSKVTIEVVDVK